MFGLGAGYGRKVRIVVVETGQAIPRRTDWTALELRSSSRSALRLSALASELTLKGATPELCFGLAAGLLDDVTGRCRLTPGVD